MHFVKGPVLQAIGADHRHMNSAAAGSQEPSLFIKDDFLDADYIVEVLSLNFI